jgi:acyl-CoA thioesterase
VAIVITLTSRQVPSIVQPVGSFTDDVVVEPTAPGRYRASLDHCWDLVPLPQGGIVTAFALRAASHEVATPSLVLRTSTSVFAGQVTAGELEIDVQVLRRGKAAVQTLATVRNVGAEAGTTVVGVFGAPRRGPSFVDVHPPEVQPPLASPAYEDSMPPELAALGTPPFWTRVEVRRALGHAPWDVYTPTTSDSASWLRFRDPPVLADGSLDPLAVLTMTDRMPGSVSEKIGNAGPPWFAPSVDLTVHLLEPLRTEWVLAHDRARWADGGWASAEVTLWDERGTIVAFATQMMLFTVLDDPRSAVGSDTSAAQEWPAS